MKDKELVRIADSIRESLLIFQKARYTECLRQLSLFTEAIHTIACRSRRFGIAISRNWLAAAEDSCQGIARQLNEVPCLVSRLELLLSKRQRGVPTLSELVAEIKATEAEFGGIEHDGEEDSLSVITEPITLEDTYLGPFRIALFLGKLHQMQHHVPHYVFAMEPHSAAKDEAIKGADVVERVVRAPVVDQQSQVVQVHLAVAVEVHDGEDGGPDFEGHGLRGPALKIQIGDV